MRSRWGVAWLGVVWCLASVVGGCGGSDQDASELPSGVAARVGNEVVRESAVRAQLDRDYRVRGGSVASYGPPDYRACVADKRASGLRGQANLQSACRAEYDIDHAQAVDLLVHETLLEREARRRGIDPARVVAAAVADSNRRLAKFRLKKKLDPDAVFRVQAQTTRLGTAIPLTEREIRDYARANADTFLESELRKVNILQTQKKADATAGVRALKHTVPWPQVQNRYGLKPFTLYWSGTRTIAKYSAPHDGFGRSLFSTRPHHILGPIRTLNGWFVFEVLTITPPRHKGGLSPHAHDSAADTIRQKKLDTSLYNHYAKHTTCATTYQIPEAPHCNWKTRKPPT
jgi:hypothetical protein